MSTKGELMKILILLGLMISNVFANEPIIKKGMTINCLDGRVVMKATKDVNLRFGLNSKDFIQVEKFKDWRLEEGARYNPPGCQAISLQMDVINTNKGFLLRQVSKELLAAEALLMHENIKRAKKQMKEDESYEKIDYIRDYFPMNSKSYSLIKLARQTKINQKKLFYPLMLKKDYIKILRNQELLKYIEKNKKEISYINQILKNIYLEV